MHKLIATIQLNRWQNLQKNTTKTNETIRMLLHNRKKVECNFLAPRQNTSQLQTVAKSKEKQNDKSNFLLGAKTIQLMIPNKTF